MIRKWFSKSKRTKTEGEDPKKSDRSVLDVLNTVLNKIETKKTNKSLDLKEEIAHETKQPSKKQDEGQKNPEVSKFRSFLASLENLSWDSSENIEHVKKQTQEYLSNIEVIAFVGESGTGKSTRAIEVAQDRGLNYFIDDGLLIHGTYIVSGTTAKKAKTKIESVRQAIFLDEVRAMNMRRALLENAPDKLMVIGTSDGMIHKICDNLWLNPPSEFIRIESITTEEDRRQAQRARLTAGQHTIPVPSMEIKHEFSGYFSRPIWHFKRRLDRNKPGVESISSANRTVVRPTFSTMGSYTISDEAMKALVERIVLELKGIARMMSCSISKNAYGVIIEVSLALYYGYQAMDIMKNAQELLAKKIEEYTSINVIEVNVKAKRVILPSANK